MIKLRSATGAPFVPQVEGPAAQLPLRFGREPVGEPGQDGQDEETETFQRSLHIRWTLR